MPRLLSAQTHHEEIDWPDQLSAEDRQRHGDELAQKLLASPTGISVEYYLFTDLRSMVIPDEALTRAAEVDGLDRQVFDDRPLHWSNGDRLAQFMADAVAERWQALGRSADELFFSLDCDDDGPGRTFLTYTLTINVKAAAESFGNALEERLVDLSAFLGYDY